MSLPHWLSVLQTVGLAALQASPLAPIAPAVAVVIAEAEQIRGATGKDKLAHVLNSATAAAVAAQQAGANISPETVQAVGEQVVSLAVSVTNLVSNAKTSGAPPTPAP